MNIQDRCKIDLKDLLSKGLTTEEAALMVLRRRTQWEIEEKDTRARWVDILRERMDILVTELREAGLQNEITLQIAAANEEYEIKRGLAKGITRPWRFTQHKGDRRPRLTPFEKLTKLLDND